MCLSPRLNTQSTPFIFLYQPRLYWMDYLKFIFTLNNVLRTPFQGHIKSNCYSFCGYTLIYLAFDFVIKLFYFSRGKNTYIWLKMVKNKFLCFPQQSKFAFCFCELNFKKKNTFLFLNWSILGNIYWWSSMKSEKISDYSLLFVGCMILFLYWQG